jgi:hypothetical protein
MADPAETIVPLAGILVIFGLPLTYAIVNRVLAHQERLEMIKHGVVPPPDPKWAKRMRKSGWYDPNAYGMQQPGAGPQGYYDSCGFYGDPNRQLRKGISLVCIGIALVVGLSFISPGRPGPWLLGGLIPMFVGIAQVVIAMLSGAGGATNIFNGPRPGMAPPPPPGPQPQAPGQPYGAPRDVTPGGYGGWRPGPTTGLEKPPSPPDVR